MFAFVAFIIVREHGGEADSCPAVCRFGACAGHVPTLCLRCTRSFVSVAWRSSSVAFFLVPLPPSAFLGLGSPPPSRVFFFVVVSGVCSFYFHWASGLSVTGAIVGGWARRACGEVAGW